MTIGATRPMPTVRASKPKETPKGSTANPIGSARRAPSRSRVVMELHHHHLPLGGEGGVASREGGGGTFRSDRLDREPVLGLGEEDAHLGEERSRRRSARFEVVDALQPLEHCAGLVHVGDGTRENRTRWCRLRAERTASAGGSAGGHDSAADRPPRSGGEPDRPLGGAGEEPGGAARDPLLEGPPREGTRAPSPRRLARRE